MTRNRRRHSNIEFGDDFVKKTADPESMRIEVEKTRRAYEIARTTGLFRVPRIMDYDRGTGTVVFERLPLKTMAAGVPWGEARVRIARRLGVSLAAIHRDLELPKPMRFEVADEFRDAGETVFIHGDLSVDNVCVTGSEEEIAVIDWQMTPLYGGKATVGPRYFDLLWFLSNLVNRPFTRFIFSNPVVEVASAFMSSYYEAANLIYDGEGVYRYALRFFGMEMPRIRSHILQTSRGRAILLLPFMNRVYRELLKSLLQ